jgi:hypothetical protein
MKLAQKIPTKHTSRVFNKKYKYKIVLILKACGWFRYNNLELAKKNIEGFIANNNPSWQPKMTIEDVNLVRKLYNVLNKSTDYELRVENPLLSLYTNTEATIESVAAIEPDIVKYVSFPKPGSENLLDSRSVITKRLDYDYKITVGRTRKSFPDFLTWASKINKVRLTKRTKNELAKEKSWGGYYFYVKDEKTLTMVKIFLGNHIQTVEKVIKA